MTDAYDTWEERAAIMEHDGKLPREDVERRAKEIAGIIEVKTQREMF